MPTIQTIFNDIDVRLPHSFTFPQMSVWVNDIQKKVYKYCGIEKTDDITVSSSMAYTMSTDCRIDNINVVLVSDATATTAITSTTVWEQYKHYGIDETLTGNLYFAPITEHFQSSVGFSSQLSFYPESTVLRAARVYYTAMPALVGATSSDSTTLIGLDDEYEEVLKAGLMERIAKSGNNPDIELGNNYALEYRSELRRAKMDFYGRKQKTPKTRWGHAEWLR